MKILLSGSHGFVGTALVKHLLDAGHQITPLPRQEPWPELAGHDAVIHLAGENIATGRWTAEKKSRIRDSRVNTTRSLCEALAKLPAPPEVLLCASAIGYYGNRGDELLSETSAPGVSFLAEVCRDWETATAPAAAKGIRVVNLRFGVILSATGGALATMLAPFKLGMGGKVGTGRQFISWIALDDLLGVIQHTLATETLSGPVNVVSPKPTTNAELTRVLGRMLHRPTLLPLPGFAARLVLGEMADALLLASQRVEPARLLASGYRFQFPQLEPALHHLLNR